MGISDFLKEKIKDMATGQRAGRDDLLDPSEDFETKDKRLRALRRMRRRQMDVVETKQLRKDMDAFQRAKDREDFIGDSSFNSTLSGGVRKKKVSVVKQSFMGGSSFFGKGRF